MRPQGEIRAVLAAALVAGHGTTRQLALRTGVGVTKAMYTLRDMVHARQAVVVTTTSVPGCKRPVPVYGLARPQVLDAAR